MKASITRVWWRASRLFSIFSVVFPVLLAWAPNAFPTDFGTATSADVGPPNSIVVDTLYYQRQSGFTNLSYHAGQVVQYRVRYYNEKGMLVPCNPGKGPQVLTHNPATSRVINQASGAPAGGDASGVVNVEVFAEGAGSFEVSCGTSVKRVLVSSDGEPLTASEQAQNDKFVQDAGLASNAAPPPGLANSPPTQPPVSPGNGTPPPAANSGMSGLTTAAIVAGAALTVGVIVAVAVAAGGGSSSSGGSCQTGYKQCSPPNASVCCPNSATIYCTDSHTCTNMTSANFGDVCNNGGNQSVADGC
ncbi:MAG: hypothetical protein ACRETO_02810 [Gammaproteobacteria bacterium]